MKVLGKRYLRCKRCHRKLKTKEAQKRGYGHYCFQKHLEDVKKKSKTLLDLADDYIDKGKV
jgi:hypothetical protein